MAVRLRTQVAAATKIAMDSATWSQKDINPDFLL